jgi:hypothetical protein
MEALKNRLETLLLELSSLESQLDEVTKKGDDIVGKVVAVVS